MRKTIAVLCSLVLAVTCVLLVGCGGGNADVSESKYIGTWKATSLTVASESMDMDEILGGEWTIELRGDGTAVVITPDETLEATWSETSNGVKVKGDDINLSLKETDENLVGEVIGVGIIFERQ